jgi:hypothetical protein
VRDAAQVSGAWPAPLPALHSLRGGAGCNAGQCSNLTPIFIGMHGNASLSPMKRVSGYTIPMVPMHLASMAPMNLVEKLRALVPPACATAAQHPGAAAKAIEGRAEAPGAGGGGGAEARVAGDACCGSPDPSRWAAGRCAPSPNNGAPTEFGLGAHLLECGSWP